MPSNGAERVAATIGRTPLVRLARLAEGLPSPVFVKLESRNPGGSVKDRIALAMIEDAETRGVLATGGRVVEPTSGNTGIGLALVCAARGYPLTLTMPDTMSLERRALMSAYGAELVLTPGGEGMRGAVRKARGIAEETGAFLPQQFANPANPAVHERTTGVEVWEATDGRIGAFVAGVGTGGTLTGVGRVLRSRLGGDVRLVAVEPAESAVLSGGLPGPHLIQGIGAGFIPEVLDVGLIDEVVRIDARLALLVTRRLAAEEGLLAGASSGAAVAAALTIAARPGLGGLPVVTVLPDTGERYLSAGVYDAPETAEGGRL